ncbi:MAG: LPS export ABC transporter periplasmic protein LptC [Rhodovibrionaceae bacterium]|nr:LPS export ABC transporter periplasmic protein LptC [Rhodovibrionaceae bacterium]
MEGPNHMAEAARSKRQAQDAAEADDAPPTAAHAAVQQPPRLSGRSTYSLLVSFLKLLLPALAVALILLVVVWPQLDLSEEEFRVGVSRLEPQSGENVSMLNARFQGVDGKGQPYTLSADVASRRKTESNEVELEFPRGEIQLDNGRSVHMDARNGLYRRDIKILDLEGGVTVFHEGGYRLRTDTAIVDLDNGVAVSDDPTRGDATFGEIDSEGVEVTEGGNRIFFKGDSRLLIYPQNQEREIMAPSEEAQTQADGTQPQPENAGEESTQ